MLQERKERSSPTELGAGWELTPRGTTLALVDRFRVVFDGGSLVSYIRRD